MKICAITLLSFLARLALLADAPAKEPPPLVHDDLGAALDAAGSNRQELARALSEVAPDQRDAMRFLIENMPPGDLLSLKADFLLAHVAEAHRDLDFSRWGRKTRLKIPREIFLNDILPYASLNERRDDSRARIRRVAEEIVQGCTTASEAAQKLNRNLFKKLNVRYSTKRKKADQSGAESIESGLASCSGLSILLVEACRSVAIPARVVGTPMWTNMRGNHTWVEIWDGDWHFTGAAEPDAQGLDRGWFKGDASKADDTKPEHRIYASSFKKTGLAFPLVWDLSIQWVPAVNVTARYTAAAKPDEGKTKVLIRVVDKAGGKRIAAKVTVTDNESGEKHTGTSSDETADLNNILTFRLPPDHHCVIETTYGGAPLIDKLIVEKAKQQIITISLDQR